MKIFCSALSKLAVIALFSFLSGTTLFAANYANWNPLADTGQTICYDDSGNEISCPASGKPLYGQDAHYIGASPSYEWFMGNSTDSFVRDLNTKLIWQKYKADTNNNGEIDPFDTVNWSEAVAYCENLSYAEFENWRLPNFFEMLSIIDYGQQTPATNSVFSNEAYDTYWTATKRAGNSDLAFLFFLSDGLPHDMTIDTRSYVRCVNDSFTNSSREEKTSIGTYQDNGDGTVTDTGTGLMWRQDTADTNNDSQLSNAVFPSGDLKPWGDAMKWCEDSDFAGYSDWRLPNIKELVSLFDLENHDPAINSTFFQCQLDNTYASSTTDTLHPSLILTAHFSTGAIFPSNRNNSCTGTDMSGFYVRCVRDEQSSNDPVTLSVNLKGSGSGTVHISPPGKNCTLYCTEEYQPWTKVTLTAIEEGDAKFIGWDGPCQGTDDCVLTLSESANVTAIFNRKHDVAVEVSSKADCLARSYYDDIFWVRVDNLGTEQAENFTVDVTYTAGESDTDSWNWSCGDEIPEGVTCSKLRVADNKVIFTLSMEPGKEHFLKGTFRNNESNFNAMTVAADLTYFSDTNPENNGGSRTLYIDPAYLPKPKNLTLLRGSAVNADSPEKNTIVFTHGWQSDNPDECDYVADSVEERKQRLECFAKTTDIWTGSYLTTGQAGGLAARNRSENALNKITETPLNIWQYVWEGAYTDSGMTAKGYIAARRNVYGAGIDLGKKLIEQISTSYSGKIHFVGHSLGTAVNAYAVKYFMEHAPYATIQMTVLDYPHHVDRIGLGVPPTEMSSDNERRWGFDKDFFSNVVEKRYDDEWQDRLFIDNYFAYSSLFLNTKLNTAGVGSEIRGDNIYNHNALIDPNDIGGEFFPKENIGFVDNDHSGVHQWYRWTMWPVKSEELNGDKFICRDRIAKSPEGWNDLFLEPDLDTTLNPCASGFAFSIVQDAPKPFPDYNGEIPFGSLAAKYDLVGGHVDNYCYLTDHPYAVVCSKKFPSESAPEQDMVAAAEETLPASNAAYMKSTIHLANTVNYMSLQYKISNPTGAEFAHILIGGQIVWSMTVDNTEPDIWIDTGKIPLFFEKGDHEFMIVFNGMETNTSTFEIKDLTFYKDPDADNFSWAMFLPAITGKKKDKVDERDCSITYPKPIAKDVAAFRWTDQYGNEGELHAAGIENLSSFPAYLFKDDASLQCQDSFYIPPINGRVASRSAIKTQGVIELEYCAAEDTNKAYSRNRFWSYRPHEASSWYIEIHDRYCDKVYRSDPIQAIPYESHPVTNINAFSDLKY